MVFDKHMDISNDEDEHGIFNRVEIRTEKMIEGRTTKQNNHIHTRNILSR